MLKVLEYKRGNIAKLSKNTSNKINNSNERNYHDLGNLFKGRF